MYFEYQRTRARKRQKNKVIMAKSYPKFVKEKKNYRFKRISEPKTR